MYAKDYVPPLSADEPLPPTGAAQATEPPTNASPGAPVAQVAVGVELHELPVQPAVTAAETSPVAAAGGTPVVNDGVAAITPDQRDDFLQEWDYVSSLEAYAAELRELVRKSPDSDLVWADRDR